MCWLGQGYEIGLNDNLSKLKETNIKYTFSDNYTYLVSYIHPQLLL